MMKNILIGALVGIGIGAIIHKINKMKEEETASFLRQSTDIHMRNHMDFVNQCNINNNMM
jgi:hypothetical protein